MATFIFPNLVPSVSGFNINYNSKIDVNPNSGIESIVENPGERWVISLRYAVLRRGQAMELRGHLNDLRGHVNKTLITDLGYQDTNPLPGTPRVDGAGQYGLIINVKGLLANQQVGQPGQRFKLGNRVHEITQNAVSDSTGRATLYLANEIIDTTADNQTIETTPSLLSITCRWSDPRQINQLQGNRSYFRNVRLTFMEALA